MTPKLNKCILEKENNQIKRTCYDETWVHVRNPTNEPPHDKSNKMTVRPAKTQSSLGIRCALDG